MRKFTGKTYWLVGASEGLGRAVALALSKLGAEVVLSARSEERLTALAEEMPGPVRVQTVDVSSLENVEAAAKAIGRIDGLIFLAGVYWPMKAQDWDAKAVEAMCDINFTGTARVVGSVLPEMVARDEGHIVLIGSLSGFRGLPGSVGYGSSKAGMMHLGESLYADLRRTGVTIQLANPGFIRTRLTEKNDFSMPFIMSAEDAADEVIRHTRTDRFKKSFPLMFSLFFRASQFFPDWLYYRVFK